MRLGFEHSYLGLPPRFHARVDPTPVARPHLVAFNRSLAFELGLDPDALEAKAAAIFSGSELPEDARPLAMAYAGHQFGNFVPQLGDGRALLLGEIRARDGVLRDVQLKGSGRTPFSRGGDGRAVLGPMLREYLISEAMHALGIPTTRSLAVVATGERVFRQGAMPGAVLTRVAASHVRVGTFQYFAARGDQEAVRDLLEYVITRHYPEVRSSDVPPALALLRAVAGRQAALIAQWMRVGFIHGVMNTDNMAISGETIDYGPCAFMDRYDPATVFSSIDLRGRYAYGNQPAIAHWNLARLAETLLPLINPDTDTAASMATQVLEEFTQQFDAHYLGWMRRKTGLASPEEGDPELIESLLAAMQGARVDFTLLFRRLVQAVEDPAKAARVRELFSEPAPIDTWLEEWQRRLARDPQSIEERSAGMRRANPAFIPRNHQVEIALTAAQERDDLEPFRKLHAVLQRPYDDQPEAQAYSEPPERPDESYRTFCGT